jgi:cardiolipin synthase
MMHWSVFYLLSEWVIRLTMLVYVPRQRSAAAARAWLLLIFLLPLPGLIFYALVGRIYLPKDRRLRLERASQKIRLVQEQMRARGHTLPILPSHVSPLAALAARLGDFEPLQDNRVELLTDYAASLQRLIDDIDAARRHVHLLYYLFEDDAAGRRVAQALARAAARGAQCRLLLDAVGSKRALRRLAPAMRRQGIEVTALLPAGLFRRNAARFDLRNHRKIAVLDGCIGYSGSQNICDGQFVRGFPNEELVARLEGPVVWQLQAVFLADYYLETNRVLEVMEVFPKPAQSGQSIAQALPSGPGYGRENAQELLIALLYEARQRVVLTTPYFVPDEPFLEAMRAAARRGVAVHLVLSAQRSFYDELLDAGVFIHLYAPRFLHAKNLLIDNDVALVGSANVDIRSFALNEEISLLFYDSRVVSELNRIQDGYLARSALLDAAQWRRRPLLARTVQGVARLADSFL